MNTDKIPQLLQDLATMREELKDIKKDMKEEEKIENEDYQRLKAALKDLKMQVKQMEDDHKQELQQDKFYNDLRELKVKKEEEIAHSNEELFKTIEQLPPKVLQFKVDTERGPVQAQIQPEMKLYLNGREERKKS